MGEALAEVEGLRKDKALLDRLDEQMVDTIYMDDGWIIDIAGRIGLREGIDAALAAKEA
ncbi:hypothetical protein ACQKEK_02280 [Pseudomonas sp. NPDC077408]|uniref:hypothetical protein n=1 Tax=Streptomyces parvus TaxID=66428 RepID=UPI0037134C40